MAVFRQKHQCRRGRTPEELVSSIRRGTSGRGQGDVKEEMTELVPLQTTDAPLDQVKEAHKAKQASVTRSKTLGVGRSTEEALSRLCVDLKAVQVPSRARRLLPDERDSLASVAYDAKVVKKDLDKAIAAARKAFFDHMNSLYGIDEETEAELELPHLGLKVERRITERSPSISAEAL